MDKEDVVNKPSGILLRHKKEGNDVICCSMNGPRDNHTKQSKSERERQIPCDITYMGNLKHDTMNITSKQKQTHRHREQTCGCQWRGGGGGKDAE